MNCDGLAGYGGWTTQAGSKEQITSAANYFGGSGGRGQRHWIGDGLNNVSGGLAISFTTSQTEIWIRWYMRYEQGFIWNYLSDQKIIYIDPQTPGIRIAISYKGSDGFFPWVSSISNSNMPTATTGWDTVMANGSTRANTSDNGATVGELHKTSDGQWHLYEAHFKIDTNGSNGVAEVWIDQTKIINATNINYGGQTMTIVNIGSNAKYPSTVVIWLLTMMI